jgi:3-dehydrosphinganine reductase
MADFSNKLVFITGGSSGIGLATAELLAVQGCNLILFARGQKMLDEACENIKTHIGASQSVNAVSMDVADNNDVQEKIRIAVEKFGVPDILINCAGIGTGDYFENISYEQFDRLMKINVYGTRNVTSAILPFMKQKGSGQIVNISSVAGLMGMYGYSLYCTSKYAIVGFSECLRSELKRFNITVTLVCPPEVKTPFIEEEAKTLPPEARVMKNFAGLMTPQQAAKAIVRGIQKKKFFVMPGFSAKFLFFQHRISNGWLTRTSSDCILKFALWRLRNKNCSS